MCIKKVVKEEQKYETTTALRGVVYAKDKENVYMVICINKHKNSENREYYLFPMLEYKNNWYQMQINKKPITKEYLLNNYEVFSAIGVNDSKELIKELIAV